MIEHPFLRSIYANARRHLDKAREAQEMALEFAVRQYEAGYRGREARHLFELWDEKREVQLELALDARRKATRLRAELRRLATEDTQPPHAAA